MIHTQFSSMIHVGIENNLLNKKLSNFFFLKLHSNVKMYVGINIYFKKSMHQKSSRRCNGQNGAPPACSLPPLLLRPPAYNIILWNHESIPRILLALPALATPQPHLRRLWWRWLPNKAPMSCLFPRRRRTMEEVEMRHVNLARFCQTRILCQRMSKLQLLVQSNPKWRKKNSWSSLESLKHLSLVSKLKKKPTLLPKKEEEMTRINLMHRSEEP